MKAHNFFIVLSSVFILSGCVQSSGDLSSATPAAAVAVEKPKVVVTNKSIVDPLTDGIKTGEALRNGARLTAGNNNTSRVTFDVKSQQNTLARGVASLQKNVIGGYDATILGKTTSFGYAEQQHGLDAWSKTTSTGPSGQTYSVSLWNAGKGHRDGIHAIEDGQTFHKILGYVTYDTAGTGTRERGHFVVGNPTETLRMAQKTKTAVYDGYFYANALPLTGTQPDQPMSISGGLRLTADFDKKNVSGQSTSLSVREAGGYDFNEQKQTLSLNNTAIVGNSFAGVMTSDNPHLNGFYGGQFYGGNAQEAAGVMTGTTGVSQTEGFFTAVATP